MRKKPSDYHVCILDKHDKTDGEEGTVKWVMPNTKTINLKHNPARYADIQEVVKREKKKPELPKEEPVIEEKVKNEGAINWTDYSIDQLRAMAKENKIRGFGNMKRETLIKKLS